MPTEYTATIYDSSHPTACGFALLTCRQPTTPRSAIREVIVMRAIVYVSADKKRWKVLTQSSGVAYGVLAAGV